jgi:fatty-acid peroxygenase
MGRHAVALRGPEAVGFFYDERHIQRHTALPEPVVSTLFGHGAVHTRDGEAHRVRKAMFVSLLMDTGDVARLVDQVTASWDEAVESWTERRRVVLFDEASRVITRGVRRWAGIPVDETATVAVARDLVAMVNGFATFGPRHWRARRARRRREAWLTGLINDIRDGSAIAPEGSAADVVARHRDATGEPLDPHTAAVELLNVLRPTVAVCALLKALTVRLVKLDYDVPEQNLTIPLHRIPTRPRDGLLIVKMDALRADEATTFTRPRTTHGQ